MFSRRIIGAAAICALALIVALSLVPGSERPHTGLPPAAEHFVAYCLTAMVLALQFRSTSRRAAMAAALAVLAALLEAAQIGIPGRHAGFGDIAVSAFGGLCGAALVTGIDVAIDNWRRAYDTVRLYASIG